MPYRESRTLLQKLPGLTVSQTLLGHLLDNLLRIHWGMLKYLILDIQISQSERMQRSHAVQQMLTSRFSIEPEQSGADFNCGKYRASRGETIVCLSVSEVGLTSQH